VFAGLTVVIALAGLTVVGVPMLTKMGLCAAGAVVVAVLVALTLVPALLGMWPDAVLSRRTRKGGPARRATDNGGSRWARFVMRRPLAVLVACVAGLGVLALPAASLEMGMPGAESKPVSSTERRAYDALADGFGAGFNGPLTIVVDARGAAGTKAATAAVKEIAKEIGATDGVVSVSSARFNPAGDTALFSAVPATGPNDEHTKDLVRTIRSERAALERATGATFEVTGSTAMNIDIAEALQAALVPYLAVIVVLALLLLLVVFRSVLVPVKAAFGFLLDLVALLDEAFAALAPR
ncbi:MMPL family transporter, partial [Streptomyces sp. NPDC005921]